MPDFHTTLIENAQTVAIESSADPIEIFPATPGKRWVCYRLQLESSTGSNSIITVKSGTTAITGNLDLKANSFLRFTGTNVGDFGYGMPLFCGRKLGESMSITNSVPAAISGWATIALFDNEENQI